MNYTSAASRRGKLQVLRFAEEVLLLLLHDHNGKFARVREWSLNYALAGGVLMDLAIENRIDTDLKKLVMLDATPTGDDLLDPVLADIAAAQDRRDARFWVERTAGRADGIRERALEKLIERGILERREDRFLWVFKARRYPVIDGEAEREVKLRIMAVLFSEGIPSPHDVVMICLADACGIFDQLLSRREAERAAERIAQVRKLDLIGQAMAQAIRDIEITLAMLQQQQAY